MAKALGAKYGAEYFKYRRFVKAHNGAEPANGGKQPEFVTPANAGRHSSGKMTVHD